MRRFPFSFLKFRVDLQLITCLLAHLPAQNKKRELTRRQFPFFSIESPLIRES